MSRDTGSSSIAMACVVRLVTRRACFPAGASASSSMLKPTLKTSVLVSAQVSAHLEECTPGSVQCWSEHRSTEWNIQQALPLTPNASQPLRRPAICQSTLADACASFMCAACADGSADHSRWGGGRRKGRNVSPGRS